VATKTKRTKDDLMQQLREQRDLLQMGCDHFDAGKEVAGKHLALNLRVLLHQTKNSHSLLQQLGLRDGYFIDTAHPLIPRNGLTECGLTTIQYISDQGATYIPNVLMPGGGASNRKIPFPDWWNNPVIKDNRGRKFSRRELVLNVSNTDGGAHVDPELDEAYMELSRKNSLAWQFSLGDGVQRDMAGPVLACMRQIAHEVLSTLAPKIV
jgi:hypothetical protein